MTEKEAITILNAIKGLGNKRIIRLIDHFKKAQNVLSVSFKELSQSLLLNENVIQNILDFPKETFLKQEMDLIKKNGVKVVSILDEDYPSPLRYIADAPVVLYVKGDLPKHWEKAIGIVGSRKASLYGRTMATEFARRLSEGGLLVVSGAAKGIDRAAHEGCLQLEYPTVAVLGCGLDRVYPPENKKLYEQIAGGGALVSEYPMAMAPIAHNFPRRNRIISGLCQGIVVVEAARRSGALITADFALEQGKEVYALPGPIDRANSSGTHELIKQGARLVTGVDDILEDFDVASRETSGPKKQAGRQPLTPDEEQVYQLISNKPLHMDALAEMLGSSASDVAGRLLSLELKAKVKQLPGKYFSRT